MANCFIFDGNITAYADAKMNNPSVKRFWKGFSLESGELNIINGEKNSFRFGDVALPVYPMKKNMLFMLTQTAVLLSEKITADSCADLCLYS